MKMNFLFGPAFWGILICLFGLSLILNEFHLHIPLVKIFIAIIIIMFGVKLLVGGSCSFRTGRIITNGVRTTSHLSGSAEYSTVFSSQTIDLTNLSPDSKPLDITAVFGTAYVELPDDIDFEFEPTSVFGSVDLPRKASQGAALARGRVKIEATAVFGKIEFEYKPANRAKTTTYADSTATFPGEQAD